ncbi:hypothetical protein NHX12_001843 [Muraenolepis orangiensis]|uniref:UBX domain-containing protein 11 n=1 Tax=Muraenolepis orangiensis TaxID=630683 RepID=A0A9Q0IFC5_9TELE|nr:hypothetical protein NHX12_001843 [Muraenolepis orangiensis]
MSSPLSMLKKNRHSSSHHWGGNGSDALRGHLVTGALPPSDFELMSSMMQRLTQLEVKVKLQAQEMDLKEKKITLLERKLKLPDVGDREDLVRKCQRLQTQVTEMEHFLADYGLVWVGDGGTSDAALQLEKAEREQTPPSSDRTMWQPGFQVNFDLVVWNIRQLNLVAGEGECVVQATAVGAQLAIRETVPLRLYSNGIVMFEGPFRSHQEPSTQWCLQNLMDGYFPSELQERFPDGVPFEVHDHRHEEFTTRTLWSQLPGTGLTVGAVNNTTSTVPGRKLTMDQFLNRLPKAVVKAETIGHLRKYLDKHRGKGRPRYDIISVFPRQCYSNESLTLPSCGLTPSATLLLRPQKGSSQQAGPSKGTEINML